MQVKNKQNRRSLLDTSAVIALLKKEPGYQLIEEIIASSSISMVNLSELISVLTRNNILEEEINDITTNLVPEIIPFSEEIARFAGKLINNTQSFGLSFGDRACISTGIIHNMNIYTTDKAWQQLAIDNIIVLRHNPELKIE